MAVADDNLHYNYIIEASVKHPAERIRNTDIRGLVRSGEGDVDDHRQADRMTSGGALSEAVVY